MNIFSYNEIVSKKIIEFNGEPYEVLYSHVFRMQKRKPVNQTKLRNLVSGRVIENTFHQNENAPEADIDSMDAKYLYTDRELAWFCENANPKNRFSFPKDSVHDRTQWLTQDTLVSILLYKDKPMAVRIPIKVNLVVSKAPPTIKGNTASGGTKPVNVVSGAIVNTPLFINEGDIIRINTDTGTYVERVAKKS